MTVSLLSWYHWSDSVWMEEARKRIRDRAEESRRKRAEVMSGDISASSVGEKTFDDDEDISILEEKPAQQSFDDDSDIEELSGFSESELRQRKSATKPTESASS